MHDDFSRELETQKSKLHQSTRMLIKPKKKLDVLQAEKDQILAELYVLHVIKDIKLNQDKISDIKTLEEQIKFTDNCGEIENHLKLYEPGLHGSFLLIKERILSEYKSIITNPKTEKQQLKRIIPYFFSEELEDFLFDTIIRQDIMAIKVEDVTPSQVKENVNLLKKIFSKYFIVVENFYQNRSFLEDSMLQFFNEQQFFQFTNFFFGKFLRKIFDQMFDKNLANKKDQFFLEILEKTHVIFNKKQQFFEKLKNYSIFYYELVINDKNSLIENYYEEYFSVEERHFQYLSKIYINILQEKIQSSFQGPSQAVIFKNVLEDLKNEKLEEYINNSKQSITRCHLLSDQNQSYFQVNKLVNFSLQEYNNFVDFIVENLKRIFDQKQTEVSPLLFPLLEQIYIFLLRVNINQKSFISIIKNSNYFAETDEQRKRLLNQIKVKILLVCEKSMQWIMTIAQANLFSQKIVQDFSIIQHYQNTLQPYIKQLYQINSQELQEKLVNIFFGKLIDIIDDSFFKLYPKTKSKLNLYSEFRCYFEVFNEVQGSTLQQQILSLKYFLLCLKENQKNIG